MLIAPRSSAPRLPASGSIDNVGGGGGGYGKYSGDINIRQPRSSRPAGEHLARSRDRLPPPRPLATHPSFLGSPFPHLCPFSKLCCLLACCLLATAPITVLRQALSCPRPRPSGRLCLGRGRRATCTTTAASPDRFDGIAVSTRHSPAPPPQPPAHPAAAESRPHDPAAPPTPTRRPGA